MGRRAVGRSDTAMLQYNTIPLNQYNTIKLEQYNTITLLHYTADSCCTATLGGSRHHFLEHLVDKLEVSSDGVGAVLGEIERRVAHQLQVVHEVDVDLKGRGGQDEGRVNLSFRQTKSSVGSRTSFR